MERFTAETLDLLRRTAEVEIETRLAAGKPDHRTVIWVVVDVADRVLIRSYLGAKARWYREVLAQPAASILVGDSRIEVRVEPAQDDESVTACSRALEAKYPGRTSTQAMLRPEILDTTLELLPVDARWERRERHVDRGASFKVEPVDLRLKPGIELDDIEGLLDQLEGPHRR